MAVESNRDVRVAGRIVRAHGIKGEVAVDVLTDSPEVRFAPGSELLLVPGGRVLTVVSARPHQGRLLVVFAEVSDRAAAQSLAGCEVAGTSVIDAPSGYYLDELIGCRVELGDGTAVGVVADVLEGAAQDLLVVARAGASDGLVPLVDAIVSAVDVAARLVVVDPPDGLLD